MISGLAEWIQASADPSGRVSVPPASGIRRSGLPLGITGIWMAGPGSGFPKSQPATALESHVLAGAPPSGGLPSTCSGMLELPERRRAR